MPDRSRAVPKRSPPRRSKALKIHTDDLEQQPLDRYVTLQRSIGRLMAIGKVDVDVDQLIERRFLCDRHRCIQWTPHERKADARPLIDRSCCSTYDVAITESDRQKVEEILPLVRRRLARSHPLHDGTEPFYDIEDDFSLRLRETDRGTCEFVLYEAGRTTCAIHKTCLEEKLDVWEYKPIACSLWPLAIVDYEADGPGAPHTRHLVTAYTNATAGLFEQTADDSEDEGEERFACLVDDAAEYEPLYQAQEGVLRYVLGDAFYDELDRRARQHLGAKRRRRPPA